MTGKVIYWIVRIVAAAIMLQTLFFKFTGAEESIYIFETIGMEPWGRYGVGVGELIASILILIPSTAWAGGLITVGLMIGAISMHFMFLGIEVQGDGGQLFIYALVVLACGIFVSLKNKAEIMNHMFKLLGKTG